MTVERQPEPDLLLVGVGAGEQVLPPILDPANGTLEPQSQAGDHDLLGKDMGLEAEATTDLGGDDADRLLRQAHAAGDQRPRQMRHLGRGPDRKPVADGRRDDAPVLERKRRLTHGPEGALNDLGGARELRLDVAALVAGVEDHPVRCLRVEGLALERPVVDEDALREVLGVVTVGGESDRHRLPDVAHAALRQRRPASAHQPRSVDDDGAQAQGGGVEDVFRQAHRFEGRMWERGADERRLESAWQLNVGQVARGAEDLHRTGSATSRIASMMGA